MSSTRCSSVIPRCSHSALDHGEVRNDPDHTSLFAECPIGQGAHRSDGAASVNDRTTVLGQDFTQSEGGRMVFWHDTHKPRCRVLTNHCSFARAFADMSTPDFEFR